MEASLAVARSHRLLARLSELGSLLQPTSRGTPSWQWDRVSMEIGSAGRFQRFLNRGSQVRFLPRARGHRGEGRRP